MAANRAFLFGVNYQADILQSATGTATGYSAANVNTHNQYETWKTDAGGTLTFTAGASSGFGGGAETRAICIISPAGAGMIGTITVRIRNSVNTLLGTFVVPRYSPVGLADRRFIFIEDETWRNNTYKIEIDCAPGSEISRVCRLGGPASLTGFQTEGHCSDLADALAADWQIRLETVAPIGQSSGADWLWPINETIPRFKLFQGTLLAFKEIVDFSFRQFYDNRSGQYPEIVIFPYIFQHNADAKKLKLMHMTSIFGRLIGSYQLQYAGIDQDNETLYNMAFQIEELI